MQKPRCDAPCHFTIVTWNILANAWKDHETVVEGQARTSKILNTLVGFNADILCLQEFEFDKAFQPQISEGLREAGYEGSFVQRTCNKPDGVVVFSKKSTWITEHQFPFEFKDRGNRVAMLIKCTSTKNPKINFIVCNTHLTFPHHSMDEQLRNVQTKQCIKAIHEKLKEWDSQLALFVGDFNTNRGEDDQAYKTIKEHNFASSWKMVHQKEATVTHRNHNGHDVPVDFIFYLQCQKLTPQNSRLVPVKALLYPFDAPENSWPANFEMSDHRPLVVTFQINQLNK